MHRDRCPLASIPGSKFWEREIEKERGYVCHVMALHDPWDANVISLKKTGLTNFSVPKPHNKIISKQNKLLLLKLHNFSKELLLLLLLLYWKTPSGKFKCTSNIGVNGNEMQMRMKCSQLDHMMGDGLNHLVLYMGCNYVWCPQTRTIFNVAGAAACGFNWYRKACCIKYTIVSFTPLFLFVIKQHLCFQQGVLKFQAKFGEELKLGRCHLCV